MTTAAKGSSYDNLTNEIKMRRTPQKQRKGMLEAPLRVWLPALWRDPWRQMGRLEVWSTGEGTVCPEVPAVLDGCYD